MNALALTYDIIPVAELTAAQHDALWEVYRRHFDASRDVLDARLARADQVICFRERRGGRLRGLLVLSLRATEHAGRTFFWLWAGALAIDRECRGKWLLERAGLEVLARFRLRHPTAPLYWVYESASFQSFRMVARSFDVFWPHPARATPRWEAGVIDRLAQEHFAERWDPGQRVVRPTGKSSVRPTSSWTSARETDATLAFYRSINPDAAQGALVIVMTPLDWRNTSALCRTLVTRLAT